MFEYTLKVVVPERDEKEADERIGDTFDRFESEYDFEIGEYKVEGWVITTHKEKIQEEDD